MANGIDVFTLKPLPPQDKQAGAVSYGRAASSHCVHVCFVFFARCSSNAPTEILCGFVSVTVGCLASTKKWSASFTTSSPATTPTLATLTPRSRPEWPCCTCPSSASSWKHYRSSMTSLVKVKIASVFLSLSSLRNVYIYILQADESCGFFTR